MKHLLDNKREWLDGIAFVSTLWFVSRIIIVLSMLWIAPMFPAPENGVIPEPGWRVLTCWDSGWYGEIVREGYKLEAESNQQSIAFFPLYPLTVKAVMFLTNARFEVAAPLVNNIAFLLTLFVLYIWTDKGYGRKVARWTVAIMACCPFSLFGTVAYSEGIFLLCSATSLWAFHKRKHAWAAFFGSLATATRVTGAALVPAFLVIAWKEKRPISAYVYALAASSGLALFSLYCSIRFHDPLAFVHAQSGWRASLGFDWMGWLNILIHGLTGPIRWEVYPPSGGFAKIIMTFGGAWLLWKLRKELDPVAVAYGVFSLILLFASGSITSVDRYVYGIIPMSIGIGVLCSRNHGWGYIALTYFSLLLVNFAIRFSQQLWVA